MVSRSTCTDCWGTWLWLVGWGWVETGLLGGVGDGVALLVDTLLLSAT